ncbi:MAG: DUF456 domain-containing protein [Candidatus Mcinerneyibacterium aminivorans]|jgi:hypothetical protein|uniref:DUF456 domain-containing protein n=1 Tax=Candidatus Mcinerneyibacterium aminivorans TaxID=2703815 RepID=A0A5D0MJC7_9BACT|nr:MAG: DUF456 domain-containing protein [Candidatus Mcinerneyibacterium aminivorans]
MLIILLKVFLLVIILAGVLLLPVGIPGNFIASFIVLFYYLLDSSNTFSFWHFIILLFLSILCEVIDYVSGIWGARKYGSSKKGLFGAIIGTILGAIIGSAIFPFIGSLIGAFAGMFLGTIFLEYFFVKKHMKESLKAGYGAVVGRTVAISFKYIVGFGIFLFVFIRFFL